MESIGRRVAQLRKEAGWDSIHEAYEATLRMVEAGQLPEPIRPGTWATLERTPGRDGPSLRNLLRARAALSLGLGRRVSLDEIVSESLFDLDPDAGRRVELAEEAHSDVRRQRSRGKRSTNGSPRKGER